MWGPTWHGSLDLFHQNGASGQQAKDIFISQRNLRYIYLSEESEIYLPLGGIWHPDRLAWSAFGYSRVFQPAPATLMETWREFLICQDLPIFKNKIYQVYLGFLANIYKYQITVCRDPWYSFVGKNVTKATTTTWTNTIFSSLAISNSALHLSVVSGISQRAILYTGHPIHNYYKRLPSH